MDDNELERTASNNPAWTPPAAQRVPFNRQRSQSHGKTAENDSNTAGDSINATELSKYDVSVQLKEQTVKSRDTILLFTKEQDDNKKRLAFSVKYYIIQFIRSYD